MGHRKPVGKSSQGTQGQSASFEQLRAHFLAATDEYSVDVLAERIASLGSEEAARFLVEQAAGSGHHAEAAVGYLRLSRGFAEDALMAALEADPDRQNLARAIPHQLRPENANRVLRLVRRVTDPATLRWLAQRLGELMQDQLESLSLVPDALPDPLLSLAFRIGLADAGDGSQVDALVQELTGTTDNGARRLLLTCRLLLDTPTGRERAHRALTGEDRTDCIAVLRSVRYQGRTEHARDVVWLALTADHWDVYYHAIRALPSVAAGISEDGLLSLVREALGVGAPGDGPHEDVAALCQRATAAARRCENALLTLIILQELSVPGIISVLGAVAEAQGLLVQPLLRDEEQGDVQRAFAALERVRRAGVLHLWQIDPGVGVEFQAALEGFISAAVLQAAQQFPRGPGPLDPLATLEQDAWMSAGLFYEIKATEDPRTSELPARLTKHYARRLATLHALSGRDDVVPAVVAALQASKDRELASWAEACAFLGEAAMVDCQMAMDERILPVEFGHSYLEGLIKRAFRHRERTGEEPLCAILTEQILQGDLVALLALAPPSDAVLGELVTALGARSATVRLNAMDALVLQRGADAHLMELLKHTADPLQQANAVEILRCRGDACALVFAGEALKSGDELLQAAAVRYLGVFGDSDAGVPDWADQGLYALGCLAVQLNAVDALGFGSALVESQVAQLGSWYAPLQQLARLILAHCPEESVRPALEDATASDDALLAVGARRALEVFEGRALEGAGDALPRRVPVSGDGLVGQRLLMRGDRPWEWGLPGLSPAVPHHLSDYEDLLRTDERIAAAWEEWMMTGKAPNSLLPHIRRLAQGGGTTAKAALALARDSLWPSNGHQVLACLEYHESDCDGEELDSRAWRTFDRAFLQCTPNTVARLQLPNPSRGGSAGEWMLLQKDEDATGLAFGIAFSELFKRALKGEFGKPECHPQTGDPEVLRRRVEEDWDRLAEHQDIYYGFDVEPGTSLREMGVYCGDRGADRRYRLAIACYLGHMATTIPVLAETRTAAREALSVAFQGRLDAAARSAAEDQVSDLPFRLRMEAFYEALAAELSMSLDEYDRFWLGPQPFVPLGTLDMACEPLTPGRREEVTLYPERHLSVANLVEKRINAAMRETRGKLTADVDALPVDEGSLEHLGLSDPGRTHYEYSQFEDSILDAIEARRKAPESLPETQPRDEPTGVAVEPRILILDGSPVQCVDIRTAAALVGRSEDTLRRYDKAGTIRFVREDGLRYLPMSELDSARIALRTTGEWARILGVTPQTVRNWKGAIPKGTDPLKLEEMLLERRQHLGKRAEKRLDEEP